MKWDETQNLLCEAQYGNMLILFIMSQHFLMVQAWMEDKDISNYLSSPGQFNKVFMMFLCTELNTGFHILGVRKLNSLAWIDKSVELLRAHWHPNILKPIRFHFAFSSAHPSYSCLLMSPCQDLRHERNIRGTTTDLSLKHILAVTFSTNRAGGQTHPEQLPVLFCFFFQETV